MLRRLLALFLTGLLSATPALAGDANLDVSPGTVHSVSHDTNVTVILVSGNVRYAEGLPPYATSQFHVERVPIIYRRFPGSPPPNTSYKTMLAWFTTPMRQGRAVSISCLGGEVLRDRKEQVQAILCTDIGCTTLPLVPKQQL